MYKTKDRFILICLIFFIGWISFFPEPMQRQYQIYTKVFLLCLLILFLTQKKDIKFLFNHSNIPLWLFLICILGSIFPAQDKEIALKTYFDISIVLFSLFCLIKSSFLSNRYSLIIIRSICIFSAIVALIGILEWLSGKNLIYEYITNNPYYDRYMNAYVRRPMSTQLNPAPLASYLLGCVPFNFLLFKERSSFFRLLGAVSLILCTAIIILTLSRAAFLGSACLFLFYLWNKKREVLSIIVFIIFLLIILLCSQSKTIRGLDRFGIKGIVYGENFTSIMSKYRTIRLKMAFRIVKDHPFFGVGLNNFRTRFDEYYFIKNKALYKAEIPYEIKIADNMYLTLLAETGIAGFLSFFIFIFFLFKKGLMNFYRLEDKRKKEILLISMSALFGLLVNMGGYELFYWHNPYALFCILCGMVATDFKESNK